MSTVITGATGKLGGLVVAALLEQGVEPAQIIATGRDAHRLSGLAAKGLQARFADFDDPATLKEAFGGASRLLLISGTAVGRRAVQHRNAIDAAAAAGLELVAYTSIPKADSTRMRLASDHRETEQYLRGGDLPFVILRNGWYMEKYTGQIPDALRTGRWFGASADGRVSAATRADLAAAAAAVLLGNDHSGRTYELGGDEDFTMSGFASLLSQRSGRTIEYVDLSEPEFAQRLADRGLPIPVAAMLADSEAATARGDLFVGTGELSRLLGRRATSPGEAIDLALRGPAGAALDAKKSRDPEERGQ